MSVINVLPKECWKIACKLEDLIPESGVCVLMKEQHVAIYYLPHETPSVYAISNWDPIGEASVLSRGIIGSIGEEIVVASPLYKQHFSLITGCCIEQPEYKVETFAVQLIDEIVYIKLDD